MLADSFHIATDYPLGSDEAEVNTPPLDGHLNRSLYKGGASQEVNHDTGGNSMTNYFKLELSSQVQQRIEENLKRGLPAEAFARATVEFGNEGCYLSLAEVLHINRLGTVFTD